jgi:hypothetical protein
MDVQDTTPVLSWLFEKYLEDPHANWDLSECSFNECLDLPRLHEIGQFLSEKGFVREPIFTEGGFTCAITLLGISQISDILHGIKYRILEGIIERGVHSIVDILQIDRTHIKRGFDYATWMKRLGMIECIFHTTDIYARPTFYGKEWFAQQKHVAVDSGRN